VLISVSDGLPIRHRSAHHEEQHLTQGMRDPPRLAVVLNGRKMIKKRLQTWLFTKNSKGEAHARAPNQTPHRITIAVTRKPPLTQVRCPDVALRRLKHQAVIATLVFGCRIGFAMPVEGGSCGPGPAPAGPSSVSVVAHMGACLAANLTRNS
jgi:hypothetical protein